MVGEGTYYKSIHEQGVPCHLQLSDEFLHIYLEGETKNLLIWNVTKLQQCSWIDDSLQISYGKTAQQTLHCGGEIAGQIEAVFSGKVFIPQAPNYLWRGIAAKLIVIGLIISVCVAGVLFYALPWLGEKTVNLVPVEAEQRLGEQLSAVYAAESVLNDSANYYMKEFVKQLDLDDTYRIDVKVIESEEINAFALPGGKIFVYSALLQKMSAYEQLVALLGHEVTHVQNRHSLKSMGRGLASTVIISSLFGDAGGLSGSILARANEFKQLDYSRELETEADKNGLQIMLDNAVNPQGMLELLQILKEENVETPRYMKYLSTHPDTDARIEAVLKHPGIKKSFETKEKLSRLFAGIKRAV